MFLLREEARALSHYAVGDGQRLLFEVSIVIRCMLLRKHFERAGLIGCDMASRARSKRRSR